MDKVEEFLEDFETSWDGLLDTKSDEETVKCAALYNLADLERVCKKEKIKFSSHTNDYLVYHTLRKLGPVLAQRLINKCELLKVEIIHNPPILLFYFVVFVILS